MKRNVDHSKRQTEFQIVNVYNLVDIGGGNKDLSPKILFSS